MANRYTATPNPPKEELEQLYISGLTQKEVGDVYGVSQKIVFNWFRKLGIQSRKAAKRDQRGEKNHMWKGDKASYAAKHHWIENIKGKPTMCEFCGAVEGRFDWCSINHVYSRDENTWIRLCRQCHVNLDRGIICASRSYSLV